MTPKAILTACALALVAPGFPASAQDESLESAARAYVNAPAMQKYLDQMMSPEGMMGQIEAMMGVIPADRRAAVATIISEEMQKIRPEFEAAMVSGAVNTFTLEEIEALQQFYSSGPGASAMGKMQPYMQSTLQSLGPTFQNMQVTVARRVVQVLGQ